MRGLTEDKLRCDSRFQEIITGTSSDLRAGLSDVSDKTSLSVANSNPGEQNLQINRCLKAVIQNHGTVPEEEATFTYNETIDLK